MPSVNHPDPPPGRWDEPTERDPPGAHAKPGAWQRVMESVVELVPDAWRPDSQNEGHHSPLFDVSQLRLARMTPIFDGLPSGALEAAFRQATLEYVTYDRDVVLPLAPGKLVLIVGGQLAFGHFNSEILFTERRATRKAIRGSERDKKQERKRRFDVGPLIELAEQNLAVFDEGELVEPSRQADQHGELACYTTTPVALFIIDRDQLTDWSSEFAFFGDRIRRAKKAAQARVDSAVGNRATVADFFIRHGLSVSMTLRVRKIDACIECGACEQACEDRYGVKRLSLHGRILGGLDFVDACHTCTDQRCIDPCNYDAISFDMARKEILIHEDRCTGCTLCALACPYDAIEMHELKEWPKLDARLGKAGALAFGDGTPRKAKLRQIASKCDHCTFYDDQACISACPTGALVEIAPGDVVTQMPEHVRQSAQAGFDRSLAIDVGALNRLEPFVYGLAIEGLGQAKARRSVLSARPWWTIGLILFSLSAIEILLEKFWSHVSGLYFWLTLVEEVEPELAVPQIDYHPGCTLAIVYGYVGTGLMIIGMAYVARRRIRWLKNLGSLQSWFDWHVFTGVFGPLYILLHSVGKLDNWVSIGFWAMILTSLSGWMGRFLTTELLQRNSGGELARKNLIDKLERLRKKQPGARTATDWVEEYRNHLEYRSRHLPATSSMTTVQAVLLLLVDLVRRPLRTFTLKATLKKAVRGTQAKKVRAQAVEYAAAIAELDRFDLLGRHLEPLFRYWKSIHIPMSVILTLVATLHIYLALRQG